MPVPNPAAAAVDVYTAVDFAAALHTLVKDWLKPTCLNLMILKGMKNAICHMPENIITVDAEAGCVSYMQGDTQCIIFSCNTPQVHVVKVEGLPRSFIGAEQALQVRRDAREMKPDQNKNVQPLAAPTSNRKHSLPHFHRDLSSSAV